MKKLYLLTLFYGLSMVAHSQQYRPEAYLKAYPQHIKSVTSNSLIWHDGTEMIFDDGQTKTLQEKLDRGDLEDQLSQPYPLDFTPPTAYNDPGRIRYETFFKKMYGATPEAVRQNLVTVVWLPKHLGQKIQVTRVNGVAEQVRQLSAALDARPHLVKYVTHIGGTFNWRKISGTNRLSMHSFGMTIDINTAFSHYWQWDNTEWQRKGEQIALKYRNSIPLELVELFEKHGFIWGGKWYHYDTMHFEYRPELLLR